jgi:rare lipoprotein A
MRISASIYSNLVRAVCLWLLVIATSMYICACASSVRHPRVKNYAVVSWYGPGFDGKLTASGERYDMNAMSCAHKTLPFGTVLSLKNINNGKTARVVVNDRGPFVRGRDIDLSRAAAKKLDILGPGTGKVKVIKLGRDSRYEKYIKGGKTLQRSTRKYEKTARKRTKKRGYFTVQVASFADKSNAEYMKKGLRLNYKRVKIIEKLLDGKKYYRVRVGKFRSESSAGPTVKRLAEEGYNTNITPF